MKKVILSVVLGFSLLFLFSGCPVGVGFPLGTGTEEIDRTLVGTWITEGDDPDYRKLTIRRKDDYSYDVEIFETGSLYSLDVTAFTAWVTKIEGRTFIYAQPVGSSDENYYLYCYESVDRTTMKTFDVSLLVNGVDGVISTEAYREEVKASMAMEDFLSDERVWKRE